MAILIKPNGEQTKVFPSNGRFTLEELQSLVGGYIEMLPLPNGKEMYINEDGKSLGLQQNDVATGYGILAGIADDDFIVGNAVICSEEELH